LSKLDRADLKAALETAWARAVAKKSSKKKN